MKRAEYIVALRELADYLETHHLPDEKKGWWSAKEDTFSSPNLFIRTYSKEDFSDFCRALGGFEKKWDESSTGAEVTLASGVRIHVSTDRQNVCKRIVVGTRTIEAKPERTEVIEAEPERTEEIVEWECPESFLNLGSTSNEENN